MNKKTKTIGFIATYVTKISYFLLLLIVVDLIFIALHTISFLSHWNNPLLSLETDQGFPEVYQYIKWFCIIILLFLISAKKRSMRYNSWAIFFTYLLLDDALEIHERVGSLIAEYLFFAPPFGLRLQDLGELSVAITSGLTLLLIVSLTCWGGSQGFKKMSIDMLLLIFALAFFGVFVDMVHVITSLSDQIGWKVSAILAVIEDGGEMFIASLILWYIFMLFMRNESTTYYLSDFAYEFITKRST
jgi:hypothetical protein